MKACRHLDYDKAKYGEQSDLKTIVGFPVLVRYWHRNVVPYDDCPRKVQFCGQGRGRINGIFQCYNPGEMSCYEPSENGEEEPTT